MEVIHESVYQRLMASEGFTLDAPDVDTDWLKRSASNVSESRLESRDSVSCDHIRSAVADSSTTFVDWDVQMSPVVIGSGNSIDVYVSSGYSVANAITVSASADLTFIKDALGASLGIDYTRTWTTQTVINIKGTVAANYSGVMITKVSGRHTQWQNKPHVLTPTHSPSRLASMVASSRAAWALRPRLVRGWRIVTQRGLTAECRGFPAPSPCVPSRSFLFLGAVEAATLFECVWFVLLSFCKYGCDTAGQYPTECWTKLKVFAIR